MSVWVLVWQVSDILATDEQLVQTRHELAELKAEYIRVSKL